jgi:ubiquinone/menaquinone biosynthesis C-methylase UbiE
MKAFYDLWYRVGTPPWVGHARSTLVEMVQAGGLLPGRTIDLGCGEGDIAIFLAEHGFRSPQWILRRQPLPRQGPRRATQVLMLTS